VESSSEWTSGTSRAIVSALRTQVRVAAGRHQDRIVERTSRDWIAWRSRNRDRVFAEIRPLRGRVQVFILPRPRDLADSLGLARRAPRTQGWGWFRSRFEISSMAQVESAARLIVQSYELGARRGNGGRATHRARKAQAL
jgi:predicted transport protein